MKVREDLPEVLVVVSGTSAEQIGSYIEGGALPAGAIVMDFATFTAVGRVSDCDCRLIQCVCSTARPHAVDCHFRKALTCAIPITCEEHGLDVCLTCDPCTCGREPMKLWMVWMMIDERPGDLHIVSAEDEEQALRGLFGSDWHLPGHQIKELVASEKPELFWPMLDAEDRKK